MLDQGKCEGVQAWDSSTKPGPHRARSYLIEGTYSWILYAITESISKFTSFASKASGGSVHLSLPPLSFSSVTQWLPHWPLCLLSYSLPSLPTQEDTVWCSAHFSGSPCLEHRGQNPWDVPGGSVQYKDPSVNAGDTGSIPHLGIKIPHAVGQLSTCAAAIELEHWTSYWGLSTLEPVLLKREATTRESPCVPTKTPCKRPKSSLRPKRSHTIWPLPTSRSQLSLLPPGQLKSSFLSTLCVHALIFTLEL